MKNFPVLYKGKLARQWSDWVESKNPKGGREKEIYPLIKKWTDKVKPKKLADIGCGQGIISTIIDHNVNYVGIDLSKELVQRAKTLYRSPKRKFLIGNAYEIPLEDNYSDSAISIWVWSHLSDLEKAAVEMHRILKPGGEFLIISANPDTYKIRRTFYKSFKMHDGYLVGTFDLGNGKVLTNSTLYLHKKKDFVKAIKKAGLTINRIKTFGLEKEYPGGLNILIEGCKK